MSSDWFVQLGVLQEEYCSGDRLLPQVLHSLSPWLLYWFAEHAVHAVCPVLFWAVPSWHFVQALLATMVEKVPLWHGRQLSNELSQYVPGLHPTHVSPMRIQPGSQSCTPKPTTKG